LISDEWERGVGRRKRTNFTGERLVGEVVGDKGAEQVA